MKLVHGTSKRFLKDILRNGIRPRENSPSMWEVESNREMVYLTNCYALHYAVNSSRDFCILVEVDTNLIPNSKFNLMADEDALEQAWRINNSIFPFEPEGGTMEERTKWFSDNLEIAKIHGFDHEWSLKVLGNCAHKGTIPPKAITKIVEYDIKGGWWLGFFDPTITIMNFIVMGDYYKTCQKIMMGETVDPTIAKGVSETFLNGNLEKFENFLKSRSKVLFPT